MSEWTEATLGDVADINPESAPRHWPADRAISYIDIASVSWTRGIDSTLVASTSFGEAPGRARRIVREGDVLVSTVRPNLRAFAQVSGEFDGEVASTGFSVVRAKEGRMAEGFAWALISSDRFVNDMVSKTTGSNYPAVRAEDVKGYTFALPPLSVQERITAVISSVDKQITALDVEAAALSLVLRRRRADHMTDESVEPVRAEQVFDFSTGVRRTPDRASGPYMTPYLRSANVGYGTLDLSDVLEMNYDPAERKKFGLQYGDVVVSEGSASPNAVGMPAMWRDELPAPVCTQMTLLRLRALEGVCIPEFVFHWSMWAYESKAFLDVAGGTNIKHISAKRSKGMAVRLPSLDHQREMAVELDAMTSALEATRTEAARLRKVRAALLSGLLDRNIDIESAELEF
ncbi:restriction endonuclease subunit S [Streptomyces globisporus]|uniref:restriction endonuclease subunit S n=1 Tax=Streptomyces globisporus TaxID=1908 RepID=UPI00379536C6